MELYLKDSKQLVVGIGLILLALFSIIVSITLLFYGVDIIEQDVWDEDRKYIDTTLTGSALEADDNLRDNYKDFQTELQTIVDLVATILAVLGIAFSVFGIVVLKSAFSHVSGNVREGRREE